MKKFEKIHSCNSKDLEDFFGLKLEMETKEVKLEMETKEEKYNEKKRK